MIYEINYTPYINIYSVWKETKKNRNLICFRDFFFADSFWNWIFFFAIHCFFSVFQILSTFELNEKTTKTTNNLNTTDYHCYLNTYIEYMVFACMSIIRLFQQHRHTFNSSGRLRITYTETKRIWCCASSWIYCHILFLYR